MNHPIRYAYLLAVVPLQLSAQTAEQTEHVDLPAVNVTGQSRTASRDSYTQGGRLFFIVISENAARACCQETKTTTCE